MSKLTSAHAALKCSPTAFVVPACPAIQTFLFIAELRIVCRAATLPNALTGTNFDVAYISIFRVNMSPPWLITDEAARRRAIGIVLGDGNGPAAALAAARGLRQYVERCGVRCDVLMAGIAATNTPIVLMVFPGRMGLLLLIPPPTRIARIELAGFVSEIGKYYESQGLSFFQSLTELEDLGRREILEAANFRLITTLIYLERSARHPWVDPPAPQAAIWHSFNESNAAAFSATLRATYCGTLDCPELSGLRNDADILAAHQSSGEFLPDCWELAEIDGNVAGCILLNRVIGSSAFEVAYMGVTPNFRGRGVGALLLRRALEKTRQFGAHQITLAVDARNIPARKLYEKLEFRAIASREAYLRALATDVSNFNRNYTPTCG